MHALIVNSLIKCSKLVPGLLSPPQLLLLFISTEELKMHLLLAPVYLLLYSLSYLFFPTFPKLICNCETQVQECSWNSRPQSGGGDTFSPWGKKPTALFINMQSTAQYFWFSKRQHWQGREQPAWMKDA